MKIQARLRLSAVKYNAPCILERVRGGAALRTDHIRGNWAWDGLKLDRCFVLYGEPLTPGADCRVITTSYVRAVRVLGEGVWEFDTENSTYRLTELQEGGEVHCDKEQT